MGEEEKYVSGGRSLLLCVAYIQKLEIQIDSASPCFSLFSPTWSTKPPSWKAFGFFIVECHLPLLLGLF